MNEKEKLAIGKKPFLPAKTDITWFMEDSVIVTSGNGFEMGGEDIEFTGGDTATWVW